MAVYQESARRTVRSGDKNVYAYQGSHWFVSSECKSSAGRGYRPYTVYTLKSLDGLPSFSMPAGKFNQSAKIVGAAAICWDASYGQYIVDWIKRN